MTALTHKQVDERAVMLSPRCDCGEHKTQVATMRSVKVAVELSGWQLGRGTEFDRCPLCVPKAAGRAA
jgi:hypothetical protein